MQNIVQRSVGHPMGDEHRMRGGWRLTCTHNWKNIGVRKYPMEDKTAWGAK